jgi:heme A synthase
MPPLNPSFLPSISTMIDNIIIAPSVHIAVGILVMVSTLVATIVTGLLAWRRRGVTPLAHWIMILAQVALIVQTLIGVKLLDQGLGVLQLYIHYVGGLGALFFFLLYYWFQPKTPKRQGWLAFAMSTLAFLFAIQSYFIGQAYVG